ncbi:MAG: aldehyde dehydrogenase PuuC, partial [Pseudomonas sp. PGPPP3]
MNDSSDTSHTLAHWQQAAAALRADTRPVIGGCRVEPLATETFQSVHPHDGRVVATYPACGLSEIDSAVAAARKAFEAGAWAGLAPAERTRVLHRLSDLLRTHGDELALMDALEMGMPITQALGDIDEAVDGLRAQAQLASQLTDLVLPSAPHTLALNLRIPHGVVGAVTPWNFPLYVALSKVVPALVMGNSLVLKPSELASLSCLRLAELAVEAGLPPGVFNVVPGRGLPAGQALARHMDVDCLTFTGSTATGLQLLQDAGRSNLKVTLLECGGKSPQLVFDDLGDMDALADALVQGFAWNSGQVCVSGTRILVAQHLFDRLAAALAER